MIAPVRRLFSRDRRCTKYDVWRCFRTKDGFAPVIIPVAHSIIGIYAPRYFIKKDYLEIYSTASADLYRLTPSGEEWLEKGFLAYLTRHPSGWVAQYIPKEWEQYRPNNVHYSVKVVKRKNKPDIF